MSLLYPQLAPREALFLIGPILVSVSDAPMFDAMVDSLVERFPPKKFAHGYPEQAMFLGLSFRRYS